MPRHFDVIDVNIEKRREIFHVEGFYYRQQLGKKFGLDKVCRYKTKVDRGGVDISGVHCIKFESKNS